jgi:predicted aspartyl protease
MCFRNQNFEEADSSSACKPNIWSIFIANAWISRKFWSVQQVLGLTSAANMPYYSFIPCDLHKPQGSELLLPKQPPYEPSHKSILCTDYHWTDNGYDEWIKRRKLLENHDLALHRLACARAKLKNLYNQPHFNPLFFLRDLKDCSNQVSILEQELGECLEKLERNNTGQEECNRYYLLYGRLFPILWCENRQPISPVLPSDWHSCLRYGHPHNISFPEKNVQETACRLPFKQGRKRKRQQRPNSSRRRIMVLPGLVNGSEALALPDTGAARNMMSERYARSNNIAIQGSSAHRTTYKLANGRSVRSKGKVIVQWKFKGGAQVYELEFQILSDCVYDVIIGQEFLKTSETLCANRHRLQIQKSTPRDVRYVNLCGSPSQILLGLIDGEAVNALPDTGSEVNIMSEAYAESRGYEIKKIEDDMDELRFADGSSQRTLGKVNAKWAFHDDPGGSINVTFEVLERCPYEVIIGLDILYEHDVYNKHTACLVESAPEKGKALPLNHVGWRSSFLERLKRKKRPCE